MRGRRSRRVKNARGCILAWQASVDRRTIKPSKRQSVLLTARFGVFMLGRMLSYVDAGKEELLPRYKDLRSMRRALIVVYGAARRTCQTAGPKKFGRGPVAP